MKKIFIIILLLISASTTFAQKNLLVDFDITYNRDKYIERKATLIIKDTLSLFHEKMNTSKNTIKKNEINDDNTLKLDIDYKDKYLLYNLNNKKLIFTDNIPLAGNFLITDDLITINWKLTSDTKTVSNILCYKATCNFRGKEWVVWYAPSIAASFGPWKLNGLPGLILEAYDLEKKISFVAYSIRHVDVNELKIENNQFKKISFKEFIDIKENMTHLQNDLNRNQTLKVNVPRFLELIYEWEEEHNNN